MWFYPTCSSIITVTDSSDSALVGSISNSFDPALVADSSDSAMVGSYRSDSAMVGSYSFDPALVAVTALLCTPVTQKWSCTDSTVQLQDSVICDGIIPVVIIY